MKTKRINKSTRVRSKQVKYPQVAQEHVDTMIGQSVLLRSIPKEIKRAKRLFEIGEKYKIEKPLKNHINSPMSVHIKGKDNKIYNKQFINWTLTAN